MSDDQSQRQGQPTHHVNIELPAELEAIYANFAVITHTPSEVLVDFARILPGAPRSRVHARVVLTPMNAKLLHCALGQNLEKFEAQHGEIKLASEGFQEPPALGFKR